MRTPCRVSTLLPVPRTSSAAMVRRGTCLVPWAPILALLWPWLWRGPPTASVVQHLREQPDQARPRPHPWWGCKLGMPVHARELVRLRAAGGASCGLRFRQLPPQPLPTAPAFGAFRLVRARPSATGHPVCLEAGHGQRAGRLARVAALAVSARVANMRPGVFFCRAVRGGHGLV